MSASRNQHSVAFLVNPIAGMGGRVGLKGTDDVVAEAVARGAKPSAHCKAEAALGELMHLLHEDAPALRLQWLTCAGDMGADLLAAAGFDDVSVVYTPAGETSRGDTEQAARQFLAHGAEIILFCGGDGTARDICRVVEQRLPILGIPAGVKMYSGVFGVNPAGSARLFLDYLHGRLSTTRVDVLDLDEQRYRQGEWVVRLYHSALTPYEASLTQAAKMRLDEASDAEIKQEIAAFLREQIDASPELLYLLGPGSTVQATGGLLDIDKTLLGIDAVAAGRIVAKDLDERGILALLDRYRSCRLILSPIGAQGFVLGRGNLQLSPEVIRRIGRDNLIVVATPAKLARTPVLRVDTGDPALDTELVGNGFLPVVIGYQRRRLVHVTA